MTWLSGFSGIGSARGGFAPSARGAGRDNAAMPAKPQRPKTPAIGLPMATPAPIETMATTSAREMAFLASRRRRMSGFASLILAPLGGLFGKLGGGA